MTAAHHFISFTLLPSLFSFHQKKKRSKGMTVIEKENEGIRKGGHVGRNILTSLSMFAGVQLVGSKLLEKIYKYLHLCETPQNTATIHCSFQLK